MSKQPSAEALEIARRVNELPASIQTHIAAIVSAAEGWKNENQGSSPAPSSDADVSLAPSTDDHVIKQIRRLQEQVHRGMSYVDVVCQSLDEEEEHNRRQVLFDAYEILAEAASRLDLDLIRGETFRVTP